MGSENLPVLMLTVIGLLWGCREEPLLSKPQSAIPPGAKSVETASLAARVDGVPIFVEEVQDLLAPDAGVDGGVTPDEALETLISNALLANEAKRRGFGEAAEVADARRLALARQLLEIRVGEGVREDTIDEKKLRRIYDAWKPRYVHGVQRRVVHFLAQTKKNMFDNAEARRIATAARAAALGAENEEAFKQRLGPFQERYKRKVRIESLTPFDAKSTTFVRPFVEGAFAVPEVTGISEPVKTRFGWHVIFVAEELPVLNRSFEEVRGELAREVLPQARKGAARELLSQLARESGVFVYEKELERKRTP